MILYQMKIKKRLAKQWKEYMQQKDSWISFYEWKTKIEQQSVQMMEGEKSKKTISEIESPRHKWKILDGQGIESTSTFPPFRGIVLEEEDIQSKSIPLVLAREESQITNTDKRIRLSQNK
jgi:hypothetical protein